MASMVQFREECVSLCSWSGRTPARAHLLCGCSDGLHFSHRLHAGLAPERCSSAQPFGNVSQAVLDPRTEVRGDRPFPLSASSGNRDGWSIYVDDFLDISILQRNELLTDEHVGYLFDGDNGDIGVRSARLLEIVSIGLLMLIRQSNPLLIYQVFTGKLAHSLQVRRPLVVFSPGVL